MKALISKKAEISIEEIYEYIAKDNNLSAQKIVNKIHKAVETISQNPYIGVAGRYDGTREFFVPRTKYYVVYEIEVGFINIANIMHTARDY
ncbi:MAG: type II toxin-antitoxin system RelE/ParE family toxin [Alphaproteobacteria bacterium]|jgi:plasmid stabilization system protein ParE|nr:type II toxin-antitoxin system RelE/ParE family toxin [Alphaproteobacteria bacterium]